MILPMKRRLFLPDSILLLALAILGAATPALSAENAPKSDPVATTGAQSEEEKACLKVLDRWFSRLGELYEKISDPTYKAIVKENIAAFNERHAALRKNFSQSPYEDLKFDAMIEHHRIARWLAEPSVKPLAPSGRGASKK
jgi:hypothetical protein